MTDPIDRMYAEALAPERRDYYVSARMTEYPYNTFERHAELSDPEAGELLARLMTRAEGPDAWLDDVVVEPNVPEVYTVGLDDTWAQISDELGLNTQEEDA